MSHSHLSFTLHTLINENKFVKINQKQTFMKLVLKEAGLTTSFSELVFPQVLGNFGIGVSPHPAAVGISTV